MPQLRSKLVGGRMTATDQALDVGGMIRGAYLRARPGDLASPMEHVVILDGDAVVTFPCGRTALHSMLAAISAALATLWRTPNRPWTKLDDARRRDLRRGGATCEQIGSIIGRTGPSVSTRNRIDAARFDVSPLADREPET